MISTAEAAWELVKRSIRVPEGGWWNKGTRPTTAGLILPMPWVDAEQCVFSVLFGVTEATLTFYDKDHKRHLEGFYFTESYEVPTFPDLIIKKMRIYLAFYHQDRVKDGKRERHNNLWTNLNPKERHGYDPPSLRRGYL